MLGEEGEVYAITEPGRAERVRIAEPGFDWRHNNGERFLSTTRRRCATSVERKIAQALSTGVCGQNPPVVRNIGICPVRPAEISPPKWGTFPNLPFGHRPQVRKLAPHFSAGFKSASRTDWRLQHVTLDATRNPNPNSIIG
jgi:hypothetical protein